MRVRSAAKTACIIACTLAAVARGADPVVPASWPPPLIPFPSDPKVDGAIRDLAAPDYQTRENATQFLRQSGTRDVLAAALKTAKDEEQKARLSALIATMPYRAPDYIPAGLKRLFTTYSNVALTDRLQRVSDLKCTDERAYLAAQALIRQESDAKMLEGFKKEKIPSPRIAARFAILAGDFDGAEKILKEAADDLEVQADFVALVALRRGAGFDPEKYMETLAPDTLEARLRSELRILLHRAAGDLKGAAAIAAASEDNFTAIPTGVLIDARDYAGYERYMQAYRQRLRTLSAFSQSVPDDRRALAAQLDGNGKMEAEKLASGTTGALGFILCEREDLLQAWCQEKGDWTPLAMRYIQQLRMREAMALKPVNGMMVGTLLLNMGFREKALTVLRDNPPVSRTNSASISASEQYRYAAILRKLGLDDLATAAEAPCESLPSPGTTDLAVEAVSPLLAGTGASLDEAKLMLFVMAPKGSGGYRERALRVQRFLAGKDPEAKNYFATLSRSSPKHDGKEAALQVAGAAILHGIGDDAYVQFVTQWAAGDQDPSPLVLLGDRALDQGRYDEALTFYRQAVPSSRTSGALMYSMGVALSQKPETLAQGKALMEFAPFLALGNVTQIAHIAADKKRIEGPAAGLAWQDAFMARYGFIVYDNLDFYERAARAAAIAEARGDVATAIALREQCMMTYHSASYAETAADVAARDRLRVLEALQKKDIPAAAAALARFLQAGPPDVRLLETALPAIAKVKPADASAALLVARTRLQQLVEDDPGVGDHKQQLQRLDALQLGK